jgi:Family of unknown function (DUF5681)
MSEVDETYEIGYQKPPKHTQFAKGCSGNPRGRPKGSKNVFSVVQKAAQEKITVTQNGKVRKITKIEASAVQLSNKAASGDPRATREILLWNRLAEEAQKSDQPPETVSDADKTLMTSMMRRIRQSDLSQIDEPAVPPDDDKVGKKD